MIGVPGDSEKVCEISLGKGAAELVVGLQLLECGLNQMIQSAVTFKCTRCHVLAEEGDQEKAVAVTGHG